MAKYVLTVPLTETKNPANQLVGLEFPVQFYDDKGVLIDTRFLFADLLDLALHQELVAGGMSYLDALNKVKDVVVAKSVKGEPVPTEPVMTKIEYKTAEDIAPYEISDKDVEAELAKL